MARPHRILHLRRYAHGRKETGNSVPLIFGGERLRRNSYAELGVRPKGTLAGQLGADRGRGVSKASSSAPIECPTVKTKRPRNVEAVHVGSCLDQRGSHGNPQSETSADHCDFKHSQYQSILPARKKRSVVLTNTRSFAEGEDLWLVSNTFRNDLCGGTYHGDRLVVVKVLEKAALPSAPS